MVKLPDQFSAGMAPSMAVRPMAAPDTGIEARAKGIAALAQGFASMAGSMGDAAQAGDKQKDALDLVKADTIFHTGLHEANNDIANNGDYETHPEAFSQKMADVRQQAIAPIRNPQARELADARFGLKTADAYGRVVSGANTLRRQDQQAGLQNDLGKTSAEFLSSQDAAAQADALERLNHYIDMAQDSRVISPIQAERFRQQYIGGSVYSYAEQMPPDRRFQTITGTPLSQYQSGQSAQPGPAEGAGQPGTITGPAATMMGQPGAQVAPQPTAGEILGTPTPEKPLQDRLVPAFSGQQPQEGQTQTAQNPFLNGQGSQQGGEQAGAAATGGAQAAPAPSNGQAAQQQVNPLQAARTRFAQELTENPALREKVLAISLGENQDPNGNRAVIESMMNRGSMMNTPLALEGRTTRENGYYAGYNPRALGNQQLRAMAEQNLEAAIQGSNVSNYATDNSSGQWGRQRNASGMYTQVSTHGDELFSYPSRADARGNGQYWSWREGVGGGTQDNPQTAAQGTQVAVASPQGGQQRYQLAQAPSSGAPVTTDAGYGNNSEPTWNGIRLPRQIDGPLNNLSMIDRIKLLDKTMGEVHKRNTEMYQQTKDAVDSDIGKLRMEGAVPVDPDGATSLDRAKQVLQPKDFQTYLGKWNAAQQQFNVLSPLDDMTEEGYAKHMKDWSSGPASSINYNDAVKIRTEADKAWDGILTKRATDPGGAADAASEVAAYNQSVEKMPMAQRLDGSYGPAITPQQYTAGLINARLSAQSRWDIAPDDQRIVSQAEAAKLLRLGENNRDVKQLDPVQFDNRMKAAARRAEILYGPEYASRALDDSLKYLVNDDTMRQLGLATAASMLTGKAPAFSDVQALQLAHTISPMTELSNVLNGRGDKTLGLPAQAVTPPPGLAQPSKQQAALLQQNPDGWQAFDRKFGAGAAARVLAPGIRATAAPPPVQAGIGRRIANVFTGSPEESMFKGSPAATVTPSDLPGAMEAGQ